MIAFPLKSHGPRISAFDWEGLKLVALENEKIRVVFWPEHGADLIEFRHKASDIDVLWKNPRVWPPRPGSLAQPTAGGSPFYDVFHGGWFASLPSGCVQGDYFGAPLGIHGELQSVPWRILSVENDEEQVRVRLEGKSVRTPLRVEREWALHSGSSTLEWKETIINEGEIPLPVAWQHHPTFGGPLLQNARILIAAGKLCVPDGEEEDSSLQLNYEGKWPHAPLVKGTGIHDCSQMPQEGSAINYDIMLTELKCGWGCIWNDKLSLGFALRWDEKVFPWVWSWVCTGGLKKYPMWGKGFLATLQPSTSPIKSFPELLAKEELLWLEPSSSKSTSMRVGFVARESELLALP